MNRHVVREALSSAEAVRRSRPNLLDVDMSTLSVEELAAIIDGMRTLSDVVSGLAGQPRAFNKAAGNALNELVDRIHREGGRAVDELAVRKSIRLEERPLRDLAIMAEALQRSATLKDALDWAHEKIGSLMGVSGSLTEAIATFRKGNADFDLVSRDLTEDNEINSAADATFAVPLSVLENWQEPASSFEEAIEALRLAAEENGQFTGSKIARNMVTAAVKFFENEPDAETRADRRWEELETADDGETFLSDLEKWRQAYDASTTEGEVGPLWHAKCAISNRIMKRPAKTAVDLAVKILVLTEYGEHDLADEFCDAVLTDARRLVPVPMPASLSAWHAERDAAA